MAPGEGWDSAIDHFTLVLNVSNYITALPWFNGRVKGSTKVRAAATTKVVVAVLLLLPVLIIM